MLFHGIFTNAKRGGDFFVGVAPGHKGEDFALAWRDLRFRQAVFEPLSNVLRQAAFAFGHGADGGEQIVTGRRLLQVAQRTRLQRRLDFIIAGKGGEDEHTGVRMVSQQCSRGLDAADARQLQIHEDDVRLLFGKERRGLFTAIRFSHDLEVILKLQRGHEAAADHEVIVDEQQ